jgi:hypothetical protein
LWKRVLLSGLLRDRKDGVMCKGGTIDSSIGGNFEEVEVVGKREGEERKVRKGK